jgi:hypothetical protein
MRKIFNPVTEAMFIGLGRMRSSKPRDRTDARAGKSPLKKRDLKMTFARRNSLAALVLSATMASAAHATCPPFHQLSNGFPADAGQVMDNYNYILGCPKFTGSVGIGTSSPGQMLEIYNSSASEGIRLNTGQSPYFTDILNNYSAGTAFQIANGGANIISASGQGYQAITIGYNAAYFVVSPANANSYFVGKLGIGTSAPDQSLSVNGGADKASGGTSWTVFSDRRLKDVNGPYERGLDAIVALHPVRFHYKRANALGLPSNSAEVGVIAQEVRSVLPEAVTTGKKGYLEFNMSPVQFAMINAIKDLASQNKVLATQNKSLSTQNDGLARSNTDLKSRLGDDERRLAALEQRLGLKTASNDKASAISARVSAQ